MASFQNMVITSAGLELLQDLILEGGTPLTFSGVGVGDGLLEDSDITARTSLVHEVHRLPIEKIEKQEGGHIRVFARLATDIITTDFYHRELGVFARHGEQEILFAYGNAGDDYDFIPATGNNASICKTIVTEFTVGSMKAVFLPLDSSDLVTHSSLNERIEQIKSGDNTWAGTQTINGSINVGTGDDLNLYIHASGGISASLSIAEMRIYRGNNDGNFYVDTGIGSSLYFDRGVYFYDAVNFASGVTMSQSLNVVGGLTATDNTTTLGNVITANISVQRVDVAGPASFSYGVTMAQSLMVDGHTTLKGGLGIGGTVLFYDSYGVQSAQITGVYDSPDENGVVFGNGGGVDFLRIRYNSASKYIDIQTLIPGSSFNLPVLASVSVNGSCSANSFQFGPNSLSYDSSNPTRVVTSGSWQFGAAAFAGGVTMSQSLHVAGVATMYRCAVYDEAYSLMSVQTGEAVWQNKSSGTFSLQGDDDCLMGVTLTIGRNDREAARVIKQNQHAPLSQTDVPNLAEGDARWVKFNNTLTDAQYAALAVKDQTTLYITDTGKIYLGSYSLN